MKQLLFTFITVLGAIWIEVSLSNVNLVLPVLFLQLFYVTVVRKWRWGLLTALVACSIIDSLLGYFTLPAAVCVIVCASFWRGIGDCSRLELQFLPVAFTMFLGMMVLLMTVFIQYRGYIEWFRWFMQFSFSVGVSAIIAPTYFRLLDMLAVRLDILTYSNVQREELFSAGD
jgi:hypothetical protein